MNEAFDTFKYLDECTEWNELGDFTRNNLVDRMCASKCLPWIFLSCLKRKLHTLALEINFKNFDSYFIANFNDFTWMIDVLP